MKLEGEPLEAKRRDQGVEGANSPFILNCSFLSSKHLEHFAISIPNLCRRGLRVTRISFTSLLDRTIHNPEPRRLTISLPRPLPTQPKRPKLEFRTEDNLRVEDQLNVVGFGVVVPVIPSRVGVEGLVGVFRDDLPCWNGEGDSLIRFGGNLEEKESEGG